MPQLQQQPPSFDALRKAVEDVSNVIRRHEDMTDEQRDAAFPLACAAALEVAGYTLVSIAESLSVIAASTANTGSRVGPLPGSLDHVGGF